MSPDDMRRATHRELVEEADRRGIPSAEWMDREGLVRALADDADRALSPLARARRFLGRVTGMIGPSATPAAIGRVVDTVRSAVEPPRPRDVSLAVAAREPIVEAQMASRIDEPRQVASDPLLGDPTFGGLRSVTRGGRTWLVWRADPARLHARASEDAALTLRTVSIACALGELGADVVVSTEDVATVSLEGAYLLGAAHPTRQSVVAAIGLGAGADFVALAHTRVI
jgi:hypothetical protein